jgi:hypothetical protein
MVSMGRMGLGLGLAIAAFLVGGCGAAEPDGPSNAGSFASATAPKAPKAPTPTPLQRSGSGTDGQTGADAAYGPQFPLTLRRTGGIAGFDDRIVLEADGRVRVETRSVHGRVCTLGASQQRLIVSLLETLPMQPFVAGPPSDQATTDPTVVPESDPITISVTDDRARQIDLSDPSLGEISGLVSTLVSDVTLSVPTSARCASTPTPSATAPATADSVAPTQTAAAAASTP